MTAPTAADPHQLDLFLDGGDAILIHEVVGGLVARDADRVGSGLAQLEAEHPAHPDLLALRLLAGALHAPRRTSSPPIDLTARSDEIERRLAPVARRFLGARDAEAFLRPLWKTLAADAAHVPFDATRPRAHAAWLHQQHGDWDAVRAAVERERGWDAQPLLCLWMGTARHHLGEPEAAIRLWLPICWKDPGLFARQAPALPSTPLREAWSAFEHLAPFDDPEAGAPNTAWFPAWLLARHPGLARHFGADDAADAAAPTRAFRALLSLLPLERGPLTDDLVGQRRALQQISPAFFRAYLELVSPSRTRR